LVGSEDSDIEGIVLGKEEGCTLLLGDIEGIFDGTTEGSNVGISLFVSVGAEDTCIVGAKDGEKVGICVGGLDGIVVFDGTLDEEIEGLTDGCVDNTCDGLLD